MRLSPLKAGAPDNENLLAQKCLRLTADEMPRRKYVPSRRCPLMLAASVALIVSARMTMARRDFGMRRGGVVAGGALELLRWRRAGICPCRAAYTCVRW